MNHRLFALFVSTVFLVLFVVNPRDAISSQVNLRSSASTSDISATSITAGFAHTCALTESGNIKCWGANDAGQLGDNTTINRTTPVDVIGLENVTSVTAGASHTCALLSDNGVKCWAYYNGELGTGAIAITAGIDYNCALTTVGGVKCWGKNTFGQLGNGTQIDSNTPVDVFGLNTDITKITATGSVHTCAVTNEGGAKCWGRNHHGELGGGSVIESSVPVEVNGLSSGVIAISTGFSHTCALTDVGAVKCWGYNFAGQLGNGTRIDSRVPVSVSDLSSGVIAIATGSLHSCALTNDGWVKCWGSNDSGQLGDGSTAYRLRPVDVIGLGAPTPTPNGTSTLVSTNTPTPTPTITRTSTVTPTPSATPKAVAAITNFTLTDAAFYGYPEVTDPFTAKACQAKALWIQVTNNGQTPFVGGQYTLQWAVKKNGVLKEDNTLPALLTHPLPDVPVGSQKDVFVTVINFFEPVQDGDLTIALSPESDLVPPVSQNPGARKITVEKLGLMEFCMTEFTQGAVEIAAILLDKYAISIGELVGKIINRILGIGSPIYPLVINSTGQRAGFLETGEIVEEIPGSHVVAVDEKRLIVYPGTDLVQAQMVGYAAGEMDFYISFFQLDGTAVLVAHENVPVTQSMRATLSSTDSNYLLEIDSNGDGQIDQSRSPDRIQYFSPTYQLYLPIVIEAANSDSQNSAIAFSSGERGSAGIYLIDPNGNNVRRIASFGNYHLPGSECPTWSPNGNEVAFFSTTHSERGDIYIVGKDGSNLRNVTHHLDFYENPTWSPLGNLFAYSMLFNPVRLIQVDGSNSRQLRDSGDDSNPDWSPDGKRLVFSSYNAPRSSIFVINVDGTGLVQLTNGDWLDVDSEWSPDGASIAFSSNRSGNNEIYVMSADGSNLRRLTNHAANDDSPTWSPNSQQLAFVSDSDGNAEIYIMNADGSNAHNVTNNPSRDLCPAWHMIASP